MNKLEGFLTKYGLEWKNEKGLSLDLVLHNFYNKTTQGGEYPLNYTILRMIRLKEELLFYEGEIQVADVELFLKKIGCEEEIKRHELTMIKEMKISYYIGPQKESEYKMDFIDIGEIIKEQSMLKSMGETGITILNQYKMKKIFSDIPANKYLENEIIVMNHKLTEKLKKTGWLKEFEKGVQLEVQNIYDQWNKN